MKRETSNIATAANWLRQCHRARLCDLGRAIYEKGAFAFGDLGEEREDEVKKDYQVCVRRIATGGSFRETRQQAGVS